MRRVFCAILALTLLSPCGAWAQNPLDSLRLEDLSATRTRPLFAPTRRPPPPVGVEAPAALPPVEEKAVVADTSPFELLGSAVGRETAFAVLRNKATGKVVRLRTGDDEEGWRIGAIASRSVLLERDGRKQLLALSASTPVDISAQAAGEANAALAISPPSLENTKRAGGRLDQ